MTHISAHSAGGSERQEQCGWVGRDRSELFFSDSGEIEGDDQSIEEVPGGPRKLRASSRIRSFLFILFFTLVWNGFLFVFCVNVVIHRQLPWFFILFMTPFVLVGLILLAVTVHWFLSLCNPVPVLELQDVHLVPGGDGSLLWHWQGSSRSVRALAIELIGRESATYPAGTTTATDTRNFHKSTLFKTQQPAEIASGAITFCVPNRTMHSWKGRYNAIQWFIRIHGEIPRWPDVEVEFPVEVYPI